MSDLSAEQRDKLEGSDFAVPGKRKLPMHDLHHAKLAWDMVDRTQGLSDEERKEARSRIKHRLKELGVDTSNYGGEKHSTQNLSCYFGNKPAEVYSTAGGRRMLKIPVARIGTFVHPRYGMVNFNQQDFDDMKSNFANDEAGFTPFSRYGHSKFSSDVANTLVDAEPKNGNLRQLVQEGDVLFGIYEPINDKVIQEVKNGEYTGASAEVLRHAISKKDGRPIGTLLTSHALTNAPFIPGMPTNQVLSDNAGSSSAEVLDMTRGEKNMDLKEALSTLANADLSKENLSNSDIEALRGKLAKLAGAEADPKYTTGNPAGEQGKAAENLSNNVNDNPAGEQGKVAEKFSDKAEDDDEKQKFSNLFSALGQFFSTGKSHGAPLKKAGKALEQMAENEDEEGKKEKLSTGKSKDSAQQMPEGKGKMGEEGKDEKYSQSAQGESDAMKKEEIEALITGVKQEFSTALAAKDQAITDLTAKLEAATAKLETTATTAQQFSNSVMEQAFQARVNGLVAQGIPAAVVQATAEVARGLRGTVQKLSNGTEVDAAEALFQALEKTPGELRVSYDQVGQQQLSQNGEQANAASVFGDVVPGLKK